MAAQENHLEVVRYLLENDGNQSIATEVSEEKQINTLRRWSVTITMIFFFCTPNPFCVNVNVSTFPLFSVLLQGWLHPTCHRTPAGSQRSGVPAAGARHERQSAPARLAHRGPQGRHQVGRTAAPERPQR